MSASQQKRNKGLAVLLEHVQAERDRLREELRIAKAEILRLRTDALARRASPQIKEGVSFW